MTLLDVNILKHSLDYRKYCLCLVFLVVCIPVKVYLCHLSVIFVRLVHSHGMVSGLISAFGIPRFSVTCHGGVLQLPSESWCSVGFWTNRGIVAYRYIHVKNWRTYDNSWTRTDAVRLCQGIMLSGAAICTLGWTSCVGMAVSRSSWLSALYYEPSGHIGMALCADVMVCLAIDLTYHMIYKMIKN